MRMQGSYPQYCNMLNQWKQSTTTVRKHHSSCKTTAWKPESRSSNRKERMRRSTRWNRSTIEMCSTQSTSTNWHQLRERERWKVWFSSRKREMDESRPDSVLMEAHRENTQTVKKRQVQQSSPTPYSSRRWSRPNKVETSWPATFQMHLSKLLSNRQILEAGLQWRSGESWSTY